MHNGLPVYSITIDDEFAEDGVKLGINKIAHTKTPAIVVKGMAYNIIEKELKFSADNIKYRIAAPLAIPNEYIYRKDEEFGEYYVTFTSSEIEKMHMKFMRDINNHNLYNEEHDSNRITDKSYLLDILLCDTQAKVDMVKADYGIDIPIGSLFTITQITNPEYYQYLVDNEMTGLSLEGFLGLSLKLNNNTNKKQEKMNEMLNLPDGEWTLGEKIYVIKDGAVVEVKDVVAQDMADAASGSTSGDTAEVACANWTETKLDSGTPARFDGELTVGTTLEVQKEDGTWVVANEGQHNLEDGRVVYVDAEGKVNEIQTPDTKKVDEVGMAEVSGATSGDTIVNDVVIDEVPYTRAEIDEKFAEIYKILGDMKATEIIEEADDMPGMDMGFSKIEKMSFSISQLLNGK